MENLNDNKPVYYVFCGIDGVLWDLKFAEFSHGPFLKQIEMPIPKPKSIQALNLLLKSLEKSYDTKLIITSAHRENLDKCIKYFNFYKLEYDKPIYATKFTSGSRGSKILDFMEEDNTTPQRILPLSQRIQNFLRKSAQNEGNKNYVVLEDNASIIKRQIPTNRTIKTNLKKESLTIKDVVLYLLENNIELDNEYLKEIEPYATITYEKENQ